MKSLSYLFVFTLLLSNGCTEREANNPFDPGGSSQSPVDLTVTSQANNFIQLNWNWLEEPISDYAGFRIYRSVDNTQNFSLYREVPRNQFSSVDSSAQQYRWYYYQVSVYGSSVESIRSQPKKIYLGQGIYWILSNSGFWVRKVSYDLLRTHNNYYTTYPPEEWDISLSDSVISLGFFRYARGISRLNLTKEAEDFFYFEDLSSPVDVEYDESQNRIYVLDASGQDRNNRIYIIRNETLERSILLPHGNYLKLYLSTSNRSLVILAETKYLELSLNSFNVTDSLLFSGGQIGQDLDASSDTLFVLTSSEQAHMSEIHKTSFDNDTTSSLSISGNFYRITANATSNQFYLAQNIPSAKDQVVKLSKEGTRLLQLSGFEFVEQIGLNPYDQSIIVVDRFADRLILYDSQGNEVSRSQSNSFFDPIRIFVE